MVVMMGAGIINDGWRQIDDTDACCNSTGNLRQGEDCDGIVIDGVWMCSECGRL